MWQQMFTAALTMGILGALFGLGLYAMARRNGGQWDDEQIELLTELLPGSNCGACGLAGCGAMARALVAGEATPQSCPVADGDQVADLAATLGMDAVEARAPQVARIHCRGTWAMAPRRAEYEGVLDCRAVDLVGKGNKSCPFGCLGLGTCVQACPFGALTMGNDGLPVVDIERCTGCGLCESACPRGVIQMAPADQQVYVACVSRASGKMVRAVCDSGCIGCGLCVRACPVEAMQMVEGLAAIDADRCNHCGACAAACPTEVIVNLVAEAAAQDRSPVMARDG